MLAAPSACSVGPHWTDCMGFPGGANGKEPTYQCGRYKRLGFDPCVGKIPWRRAWQPTPVFLPRESQPGGFHPVHEVAKSWT